MAEPDESPPRPWVAWRAAVADLPPALLVGLVLSVVLGGALRLYQADLVGADRWRSLGWARVAVGSLAVWFTGAVLVAIGLGQLRARLRGLDRTLVTVAVVVATIVIVRPLVRVYFDFYDAPQGAWGFAYYRWSDRLHFWFWLVAAGCLAAALARRGTVGVALGGLVLATTVLLYGPQALSDHYYFADGRRHAWANAAISIALTLARALSLGAAAWWLGRGSPTSTRPGAFADGLARIERALVARVVLAVGTALLTMLALAAQSLAIMKLVVVVVPLALLFTQISLVAGMVHAAAGPDAARARLSWAAGLTVLVSFGAWCQAIAAYVIARARWGRGSDGSSIEDLAIKAQVWPYLGPALGVAALLLLLWAIADVRRSTPSHDPPEPFLAGVWAVVGTASALALPHLFDARRVELTEVLLLTLFVAIANMVATLSVARACGKAAAALRNVAP